MRWSCRESPLIWLFNGVSSKITISRSSPVLPSYLRQALVVNVLVLLCSLKSVNAWVIIKVMRKEHHFLLGSNRTKILNPHQNNFNSVEEGSILADQHSRPHGKF